MSLSMLLKTISPVTWKGLLKVSIGSPSSLKNADVLGRIRLSLRPMALVLLCALSIARTIHAEVTTPLTGVYSLQGGTPLTDGHLRLSQIGTDPLKQHIDLWMTLPKSAVPIRTYAVEMTKKLHMVVVSSDFSIFLHIHPELSSNGHFLLDQEFPKTGIYYIYADGQPHDMNHQVFRFEVNIGGGSPKTRTLTPTGREVNVGPYTVDISDVRLRARSMGMVSVHISKGDKPATDLHPYLGAAGHAVFLNGQDLSYVHVHPMAMGANMDMSGGMDMSSMKSGPDLPDNASSPPDMMLHITLYEPGTYRMWLQFRGGSQLYVAPFVLTAQ